MRDYTWQELGWYIRHGQCCGGSTATIGGQYATECAMRQCDHGQALDLCGHHGDPRTGAGCPQCNAAEAPVQSTDVTGARCDQATPHSAHRIIGSFRGSCPGIGLRVDDVRHVQAGIEDLDRRAVQHRDEMNRAESYVRRGDDVTSVLDNMLREMRGWKRAHQAARRLHRWLVRQPMTLAAATLAWGTDADTIRAYCDVPDRVAVGATVINPGDGYQRWARDQFDAYYDV